MADDEKNDFTNSQHITVKRKVEWVSAEVVPPTSAPCCVNESFAALRRKPDALSVFVSSFDMQTEAGQAIADAVVEGGREFGPSRAGGRRSDVAK
ncbi:hypothetical protein EVAR_89745_1 [Eumeta japonica]|uniref:Uncharacterized protein n=1 Tax=Eumeta variegata TaxID=151549 RepID=A0A4C1Y4K0_EUMVA|nr:hypothetical protein EVAR_89745_1 [Eumeta japonica]